MKYYQYFHCEWGTFYIEQEDNCITQISFLSEQESPKEMTDEYCELDTEILQEAKKELEEYFKGNRKKFEIPIKPAGTNFQKKVWKALCSIPYGETRSYQDIAVLIGNKNACRAVGMANNKNPIMIVIPCHRVIGKDGQLVGYGAGLSIKRKLLELEQ